MNWQGLSGLRNGMHGVLIEVSIILCFEGCRYTSAPEILAMVS